MKRTLVFLALLITTASFVRAANDGTILSLTASGGANFNENITISINLRADARVNNSNVTFQIIAPSGVVVATHRYDPPTMQAGDTANYSWGSHNGGYPDMGTYTISACWSTGGSGNCNIASASTTFYSADSLGPLLFVGLALMGGLLIRIQRAGVAG